MSAFTFIGHKECERCIVSTLYEKIENLILNEKLTTFYVRNHGSFDYYAYQVLCELEQLYNIEIIVVLSHLNPPTPTYYDLDKTVFPDILEKRLGATL